MIVGVPFHDSEAHLWHQLMVTLRDESLCTNLCCGPTERLSYKRSGCGTTVESPCIRSACGTIGGSSCARSAYWTAEGWFCFRSGCEKARDDLPVRGQAVGQLKDYSASG